jgi:uncharacterized Ntn-hydrolase superfamily protein
MTFSVMGFCERSGAIGIASGTSSIAVGARLGQRVEAGGREWMVASQAVARPGLGFEAGDLLAAGTPMDDLEPLLAAKDPGLAYRQLAVIERGGDSWVFTGDKASHWKGHVAGPGFVAFGNALAGAATVEGMARGFTSDAGADLAERLVRALEEGRDGGGQADGEGNHLPELTAFVRVFQADADAFVYGDGRSPVLDLRIDCDIDAVTALRRLYERCKPLREDYELRGRDPQAHLDRASNWEMTLFEEDS